MDDVRGTGQLGLLLTVIAHRLEKILVCTIGSASGIGTFVREANGHSWFLGIQVERRAFLHTRDDIKPHEHEYPFSRSMSRPPLPRRLRFLLDILGPTAFLSVVLLTSATFAPPDFSGTSQRVSRRKIWEEICASSANVQAWCAASQQSGLLRLGSPGDHNRFSDHVDGEGPRTVTHGEKHQERARLETAAYFALDARLADFDILPGGDHAASLQLPAPFEKEQQNLDKIFLGLVRLKRSHDTFRPWELFDNSSIEGEAGRAALQEDDQLLESRCSGLGKCTARFFFQFGERFLAQTVERMAHDRLSGDATSSDDSSNNASPAEKRGDDREHVSDAFRRCLKSWVYPTQFLLGFGSCSSAEWEGRTEEGAVVADTARGCREAGRAAPEDRFTVMRVYGCAVAQLSFFEQGLARTSARAGTNSTNNFFTLRSRGPRVFVVVSNFSGGMGLKNLVEAIRSFSVGRQIFDFVLRLSTQMVSAIQFLWLNNRRHCDITVGSFLVEGR